MCCKAQYIHNCCKTVFSSVTLQLSLNNTSNSILVLVKTCADLITFNAMLQFLFPWNKVADTVNRIRQTVSQRHPSHGWTVPTDHG